MQPEPEHPDVEAIMTEVRQGLSQVTLSPATKQAADQLRSMQAALDQMTAAANLLGQCPGSLRGRLCQALNPAVVPVTDQINRFHTATLDACRMMSAQMEKLEQRLQDLEQDTDRTTEAESP